MLKIFPACLMPQEEMLYGGFVAVLNILCFLIALSHIEE